MTTYLMCRRPSALLPSLAAVGVAAAVEPSKAGVSVVPFVDRRRFVAPRSAGQHVSWAVGESAAINDLTAKPGTGGVPPRGRPV